jgi:hypothetical protein
MIILFKLFQETYLFYLLGRNEDGTHLLTMPCYVDTFALSVSSWEDISSSNHQCCTQ